MSVERRLTLTTMKSWTMNSQSGFAADWPAPGNVRTLLTTRLGGVSRGAYSSMNLGQHVGDDPLAVAANRQQLTDMLAACSAGSPVWLNQVHGTRVVNAAALVGNRAPEADASFARAAGVVCAVMTADCLPVLFCDASGTVVAAAHAGWRGLLAGVLEEAVAAMGVPGEDVIAYLGPAIGPQAFEVGDEVRSAFVEVDEHAAQAFKTSVAGKWLADIYWLARQRLQRKGVTSVYGGMQCTYDEADRFFSYRRDGQTGRMASLIWLDRPE